MSVESGPSVAAFVKQAQRRRIVPSSAGFTEGGAGEKIDRPTTPEEIIERLERALDTRVAWLVSNAADPEVDSDVDAIRREIDASKIYLRAALGMGSDGLEGATSTLEAFNPETLKPVVYECASLEEAWQRMADLSGEDAGIFPKAFEGYACGLLLHEPVFAPKSVRVAFNPLTQAIVFSIDFGKDEARIKGGLTRNHLWDGKYGMAKSSLSLVIPAEDAKKSLDEAIDFNKEYTWDEAVDLLMRVFKVEKAHIEAVFRRWMDFLPDALERNGELIKFERPSDEHHYRQFSIRYGHPGEIDESDHAFGCLGAKNGMVNLLAFS